MTDIVSTEKRSRMMSGIRSKDTKPELLIRKGLHRSGFRYLLHDRTLPGKPDMVFPKYHAVIFVNGCFWHMHSCHLFRIPGTRKEFWIPKLELNRKRDQRKIEALRNEYWRICIIWECAIRGKHKMDLNHVIDMCAEWLQSEKNYLDINGFK